MFARTQRLLLRPGWIEDAPALTRAIGDEAIVRNLARAPWPYARRDAEDFLNASDCGDGLPSLLAFSRTAGTPRLIGGVGLHRDGDGNVELGYWIARACWGLGYATEACRALLALADHSLRIDRIVAGHFLDNPASGHVLRKLGFRPSGDIAPLYSVARRAEVQCMRFSREADREISSRDPRSLAA